MADLNSFPNTYSEYEQFVANRAINMVTFATAFDFTYEGHACTCFPIITCRTRYKAAGWIVYKCCRDNIINDSNFI